MSNTLEICVDAPEDLATAINAGVDRIELCSALDLGGLTSTPGLIEQAKGSEIPIYAMIRPRAGDFTYSEIEIASMEADIAAVREAGLAGVVFGAIAADGQLDTVVLRRLCHAAGNLGKTLHRAIDELDAPSKAVQTVIELGFERILTSGGAAKADQGVREIASMIEAARGKIEIMAGSGVNAGCVPILADAGVSSFHASCSWSDPTSGNRCINPEALQQLQSALA